jgi:hypothetical protein
MTGPAAEGADVEPVKSIVEAGDAVVAGAAVVAEAGAAVVAEAGAAVVARGSLDVEVCRFIAVRCI